MTLTDGQVFLLNEAGIFIGANARIKLMHHDMPLFWATLARDHGGVWLVRNPLADGAECRLLAPIDSPTVEQHAALALGHLPPDHHVDGAVLVFQ